MTVLHSAPATAELITISYSRANLLNHKIEFIIKYKEVLSALETATDKCKSVANVLESITVKHS